MSNDLWGNFAFVLREIDTLCLFDAFELMLMIDAIENGLIKLFFKGTVNLK